MPTHQSQVGNNTQSPDLEQENLSKNKVDEPTTVTSRRFGLFRTINLGKNPNRLANPIP